MKRMYPQIPDHPVIRNMERTGYPDGKGPKVIHTCIHCHVDICHGETYYDIDGEPWCEECINDAKKTADEDDWY